MAAAETSSSTEKRPANPSGMRGLVRVRLTTDLAAGDLSLPAGSRGTIVHRYAGGRAFEVEFAAPTPVLLTVEGAFLQPL
jgi:hypothetical protein